MRLCGKQLAAQAEMAFEEKCRVRSLNQTPIEKLMVVGLSFVLESIDHFAFEDSVNEFFRRGPSSLDRLRVWSDFEHGITIYPQMPIGKYVVDFFVDAQHYDGGRSFGIIECDGHDFHERTKEQAAHDKARDRFLQSEGYLVLRFTGSEIYRDPVGAADSAVRIIYSRAENAISEDA